MNIQVLDKGFVRLETWEGGDQAVVRSARVSYGSESKGEEADKKLIKYLLAHDHGSPFEHAFFTFHVKLPIFVARQWVRHRMCSYNEISARYTEMKEEFYIPKEWRTQDTKNKQGSLTSTKLPHDVLSSVFLQNCEQAFQQYKWYLDQGVAREMARMILPTNLFTEWYWTVNARSLLNFLALRCDNHAQWETRQYAHAIAHMMRKKMPWTFEAWEDSIPEHKRIGYQEMRDRLMVISLAEVDTSGKVHCSNNS